MMNLMCSKMDWENGLKAVIELQVYFEQTVSKT